MQLLFIVLPIFLLIALGYGLRHSGIITRDGISVLNNFAYFVALPALILMSFWNIDWLDANTQNTLLLNTLFITIAAAILFSLVKLLPVSPDKQAGIFAAGLVGNTIYMGFPIGERALTAESFYLYVAAATPHLVFGIVLTILVIEWLIFSSQRPAQYVKDFLLNPLILSLLAGIGLSISGVTGLVIDLVKEVAQMLAVTASPIALVGLGAFLYGIFRPQLALWGLFATSIKVVVLPIVVFLVGSLLGVDSVMLLASILAAAMPTAVTSFVIAERYNAAPELVATTLFISTITSLVTLSLLLFLML